MTHHIGEPTHNYVLLPKEFSMDGVMVTVSTNCYWSRKEGAGQSVRPTNVTLPLTLQTSLGAAAVVTPRASGQKRSYRAWLKCGPQVA